MEILQAAAITQCIPAHSGVVELGDSLSPSEGGRGQVAPHLQELEPFEMDEEIQYVISGGKRKALCKVVDCKSMAKKYGVCKKHGGRDRCRLEGCDRYAAVAGLCVAHGRSNPEACGAEGCDMPARISGYCTAHGAYSRGRSEIHGALLLLQASMLQSRATTTEFNDEPNKRKNSVCRMKNCDTPAHVWNLCRKHGGFYKCAAEGCEKHSQKVGLCWAHYKVKREMDAQCKEFGCDRRSRKSGLCRVHLELLAKAKENLEWTTIV